MSKGMSYLFFICGAHCAGKTSIIKKLYNDNVINFAGYEIGKEFYYERKKNGFNTQTAIVDFEYEVLSAELERDRYLNELEGKFVVETWHPGNLAYVYERSPEYYKSILHEVNNNIWLLDNLNIKGIWLEVSKANIYKRTKTFKENRMWAADFYNRLNSYIGLSIYSLGLENKVIRVDANDSLENTYKKVLKIINEG